MMNNIFGRSSGPSLDQTPNITIDTPHTPPHEHDDSTSLRPGKFVNVHHFARPEGQEASPASPEYLSALSLGRICAPCIVHIKDKDPTSRIHDRIMLIIRDTSSTSLTCLSFCKHSATLIHNKHCIDHAKLISEPGTNTGAPPQSPLISYGDPSDYFELHVSLGWSGCKLNPVDDAYLNLMEIWNIESNQDVKFAVLGQATCQYWPAARSKIIDVFASSVGGSESKSRQSLTSDRSGSGHEEEEKEKEKGQRSTEDPLMRKNSQRSARKGNKDKDRRRSK